ncbi:MAG: extracellular solute-binding protein, partial [Chloroflexota bacterium]|nr:extracellular solute-binding protein [Chloroflexota bacterium]
GSLGAGFSRRRILGGAAGLSATVLAACGTGPAASGGEGAPAASGRVVELRAHARANSEKDGYQKSVDAFNQQFAGKYKAVYEGLAGSPDYYGPLETNIAGGTLGDVIYAHTSNLKYQEYAVKSVGIALDQYAAKDKNFKLDAWPQNAQAAMKVVENKLFGMPTRGQVSWLFLYWNKEILKRAGVPDPTPDWTHETFLSNARKLVGQGGSDFFPVGHAQGGGYENVVANLRRFGGDFFAETTGAGKKATLDTQQAVQTFRWYYDNIKSGLFGPRSAFGAAEFGQGRMGFYFGRLAGERGTVANNAKGAFEWTFDVVPKGTTGRRGGFLSVDMSMVTSMSKDRDAAWELLKWVTNRDSGVNLALQPEGSLTPGFRKDVYCDDRLLNDPRFPKDAMRANCDNIEQPDTYVYPANFRLTGPGGIQEVLDKYLNPIFDLQQEPTPAYLKELNTEVQRILDMPRL